MKPKSLKQLEDEKREKNRLKQQLYRSRIYKNKKKHEEVKDRDQKRKLEERKIAKEARSMNPELESENRKYERDRKRKQREKKKQEKEKQDPATLKRLERNKQSLTALRARRRFLETSTVVAEKKSTPTHDVEEQVNTTLKISKSLFNSLTPTSKKKAKLRLRDTLSPGGKRAFRKLLGVNLSNEVNLGVEDRSGMAEKVKNFFDREDVTRVCPDTRKFSKDPVTGEKVPLRYRLHYLTMLHSKFLTETTEECCYETFTRHVPHYVKKPTSEEWGTCLCMTCLNPELKLERLQRINKISAVNVEEIFSSDEKFEKLKNDLLSLKPDPQKEKKRKELDDILRQQETDDVEDRSRDSPDKIKYTEWGKVKYLNKNKKTAYRSRKQYLELPISLFIDSLLKEMDELKSHLYRAHMQYRAFKEKRARAENTDHVLTIQMDWSENQKVRQAKEEKGAYYHQDQYSIHAMRAWTKNGAFSHAAMSEETSHKAPAVFASIEDVLKKYISEGITEINAVTDSPSSQYRNKNAFWLMKELCVRCRVKLNWIFLEAGHGKGIPDGIGGCVKRAMKDVVGFDPDAAWNSLHDFLPVLPGMLPSIEITTYNKEDIDRYKVPDLDGVKGSNSCHEVNFFLDDNDSLVHTMKKLSNEQAKSFSFKLKLKNIKKQKLISDEPATTDEDELEDENEEVEVDYQEEEDESDIEEARKERRRKKAEEKGKNKKKGGKALKKVVKRKMKESSESEDDEIITRKRRRLLGREEEFPEEDEDSSEDEMRRIDAELAELKDLVNSTELGSRLQFEDIDCYGFSSMEECWKKLNPPNKEEELLGEWFACIYTHKKVNSLYFGKVTRRFLSDNDNGYAYALELDCLPKKYSSVDCFFEDYKEGEERDISIFAIHDVISGPLRCRKAQKGNKWEFPQYDLVNKMYNKVVKQDRVATHKSFICNLLE